MARKHPRVLFLVHALGGGGAERVTVNLANYLVEEGWPVSVLPLQVGGASYPVDPRVQLELDAPQGGNKYVRGARKLKYVRDVVKRVDPDVVVTLGAGFGYLTFPGTRDRFKLVTQVANDPGYLMSLGKFNQVTYGRALDQSDAIVFQTQAALDYYDADIRRKGVIISNPLRDGLVHNSAPFESREKEIVSFGRLHPQKRPDVLLDAFAQFHPRHPEYRLSIFGEGPLEGEMRAQIERLGLGDAVTMHGFHHDIHSRIGNAAMYVLSSDVEGLPNAMLEAMAIGLPSVCADCSPGGARETIDEFNSGVLVPRGNPQALADAMDALVNDPERANDLIRAGAALGQSLVGSRIYKEWADVIEDVTSA